MDSHSPLFFRDRRFSPRHNIKIPLRVRVRKSGLPQGAAESANLSERGIFFITNSSFSEGDVVEVFLKTPRECTDELAAEWCYTGHVVRVESGDFPGGKFGVGVQFYYYESGGGEQPASSQAPASVEPCQLVHNS